jgi:CubicO group peptidase (beta-lactamase class C family)
MQKKRYILLSFLFTLSLAACEENNNSPDPNYRELSKKISEIINNKMTEDNITGLSISVVDDQRLVWSKGFGMADSKGNMPATSKTLYPVALVTKVFTATAIMQLAEQSQLDIDHSYITYVPEIPLPRESTLSTYRRWEDIPASPR